MKKILLLILGMLFLFSVKSQNNKRERREVKRFLHSFLTERGISGKRITLVSTCDTSMDHYMRQALNEDGITFGRREKNEKGYFTVRDTFALSTLEREAILDGLKHNKSFLWGSGFNKDFRIIPEDTIWSIYSRTKGSVYNYLKALYGDGKTHGMSYPIFFRDYRYCVFTYSMGCGELCAEGILGIYKRRGKKWKLYFTLVTMVS